MEEAYAVMRVNLRPILECCADNGIYLGVEPHGPYTAHKQSMLRIMELYDSPWLKVNFDTGNSYLAGEDPVRISGGGETQADPPSRQGHQRHSKRCRARQGGGARPWDARAARGVIDWRRIVAILRTVDYQGALSVECGTEEQAADSLKHLQDVLGE